MQAMISSRKARPGLLPEPRINPCDPRPLMTAAEREARAILAVSSPETRHSSTYSPVSYYPPYSHRSERGQMHDALASSLSAFLAAPDSAEYLRSKQ
jgi:hypothetical protein